MNKFALGCGVLIAILLFVVVVAAIAIGGSYNRLVRLQQAVDQSWAQVQNVYQRRADLIPNLVNTVSGAANFEKSTLVEVTNARASVGRVQMQLDPNKAPTDAAQLEQFQAAQGQLSTALSRLLLVSERYPELKANQNFLSLQAQLEGTENRISVERGNFNKTVQDYNVAVRSFPTNLIAGMLGFPPKPFFAAQPGAEKPPPVQFNFSSPAPAAPAATAVVVRDNVNIAVEFWVRMRLLPKTMPNQSSAKPPKSSASRSRARDPPCSGCAHAVRDQRERRGSDSAERLARYFNDYAGVVSKEAASRFNEQLAQFERETSDQVVVAVFPKMQSDSDIADYTQRVAQAWGVGQKERRNGVVLFVFIQDRKMFIQVGYGLEGALPDATAFDITERHIKPLFRTGNYEAGLATGIDLICKAIRGEYKGSGKTVAEGKGGGAFTGLLPFIIFVIVLIIISRLFRKLGGYGYSSRGGGPVFIPSGGGWSSGGGGSGGGFSGFGGGGGSFGGGGAGSSW